MMKLKVIISIILIFTMLSGFMTAFAAGGKATLELPFKWTQLQPEMDSYTPFKPPHNYSSMQNPPDFTWTDVKGATSYDIVIARDEALTDIAYLAEGLQWHYYNFPYSFEPGVYWWAVRYYVGKQFSDWCVPKKFRIDPEAREFTVPPVEEISKLIPNTHPRMWVTPDTIDEFRKRFETEEGKAIYDGVLKTADTYIKAGIPEEPEPYTNVGTPSEIQNDHNSKKQIGYNIGNQVIGVASAYLFSGDEKYGKHAIDIMMAYSTWEYDNTNTSAVSSFKGDDQVFWENQVRFALAYDWCYNLMTPEQRKNIGENIKGRFDYVDKSHIDGIRTSPYNSHLWGYMHCYLIPAMVLVHDYPGYDKKFSDFLTLYTANSEPMCTEDGGWSKGTAYWTYSFIRGKHFIEAMKLGNYLDYFNKAWINNEYLWAMYMMPKYSYGSFGDESARGRYESNQAVVLGLNQLAYYTNNPYAAWARDQKGNFSTVTSAFNSILSVDGYRIEPKVPYDHPNSQVFIDQGISAHHSSLTSDNKVSMYFRSSPYGSYNHMHADNNAFMIEANGERLATKGGWYDSYHSVHDSGFTRKTYAHNSVTYDFGQGQVDDSMTLGGQIDMYVTHADFDAVVGNATKAYDGGIDKFVRSMIYIRPDTYIVIDDLVAGHGGKSNFEWWLNTVDSISLHEDGKGARIDASDKMALDARIHYPEKVTGYYSNLYSGPDLVNFPTLERYASYDPDKRIWFETEKVEATKIVSTLNVHEKSESASHVKTTKFDNYMKLEFEDGTIAIVNTAQDETIAVDTGDIQFTGTALVYNDKTFMLVGGTKLTMYGIDLIDSENVVTVVYGNEQLSVSQYEEDYKVTIHSGNDIIPLITDVKERKNDHTRMPEGKDVTGFGVIFGEGENAGDITIDAMHGHYAMLVNGKPLPGSVVEDEKISVDVIIDGVSNTYETDAVYNYEYEVFAELSVPIETKSYLLVDMSDGLTPGVVLSKTEGTGISDSLKLSLTGIDKKSIELKSVPLNYTEVTLDPDYEAAYKAMEVIVEAEDYVSKTGTTRLSQGTTAFTGVSQLNPLDSSATYEVTIPEDGTYNFVIRAASWQRPWPVRCLEIDGEQFVFELFETGASYGGVPEDLQPFTIHANKVLKAGTYTFKITSFDGNGFWNYDWIGFDKVN